MEEKIKAYNDICKTLSGLTMREAFRTLCSPFPQKAIKERGGSGASLSSIDAAYQVERLNEVFGPCGFGWDYGHDEIRETGNDRVTEVWLSYAYMDGGPGVVWSRKILAHGSRSVHKGMSDGDARKSCVTDGLTKAASMIGLGIDVFKGIQTHKGMQRQDEPHTRREEKQREAQKKADAEIHPVTKLYNQAHAAGMSNEEWKKWTTKFHIDGRTRAQDKLDALAGKIHLFIADKATDEKPRATGASISDILKKLKGATGLDGEGARIWMVEQLGREIESPAALTVEDVGSLSEAVRELEAPER